ncbi:hypothetical protein [Agromyces aureus]|uniref:Hemagglutinin n=1 Tax=Agromyces aureus TaxID=453304 RepID=A0A191WH20_9MICO|nr:hypothetical protein [Agromyces aureus]ANJ27556.1 hypothetical protein ATC03_13385 [Agromyces aureus]
MSSLGRIARLTAAVAAILLLASCAPADRAPLRVDRTLPEPPTTEFDPSLIVSDDAFYDSTALGERQIQAFLEGVSCRADVGIPCLAEYTETTTTQPAVGGAHCAEYRGGDDEPASRILAKVSVACGISPKTLLVLLQKEQSLLTRPTAAGYERATGYACPDTADCDQKYFGFFNQVYNAAWQFRQYTELPDRRYMIGETSIGYNPDAACGASTVDIRNQATANLYNYTPYQPNPATLADPAGGDVCGAYGNLNFWRLWHRWFGDPTAERFPAFFSPCTRLVGGHACALEPTLPAVAVTPT